MLAVSVEAKAETHGAKIPPKTDVALWVFVVCQYTVSLTGVSVFTASISINKKQYKGF